jgi:hypothetical protein
MINIGKKGQIINKAISETKMRNKQTKPIHITINLINIPTNLIRVLTITVPKNSSISNLLVYESSRRRHGENKVFNKSGIEKNLYVAQKKFEKIP